MLPLPSFSTKMFSALCMQYIENKWNLYQEARQYTMFIESTNRLKHHIHTYTNTQFCRRYVTVF